MTSDMGYIPYLGKQSYYFIGMWQLSQFSDWPPLLNVETVAYWTTQGGNAELKQC